MQGEQGRKALGGGVGEKGVKEQLECKGGQGSKVIRRWGVKRSKGEEDR